MQYIYFDNAASTKPLQVVTDLFQQINNEFYANPSSSHGMGVESEKLLENSRRILSEFLRVKQNEIIFTSGGTESINIALKGIFRANYRKKDHIITTKTEHAATYESLMDLNNDGATISFLSSKNDGTIDLDELKKLLTQKTLAVSLIHVNNESGIINPIKDAVEIVRSYDPDIFIHVDAVQSFGKLSVNDALKDADMFSCSAHKVHGPKGIGFLFVKNGTRLVPLISGGRQEKNLRSGTTNLPLIYPFSGVVNEIKDRYINDQKFVSSLKEYLVENLENSGLEYKINFTKNTSPYIINISFIGVKSEILMHYLEMKGIIVSAGAACSSKRKKNRVLEGYGLSNDMIESAIRISFSKFNTKKELDIFVDALSIIIPNLKG